MLRIVAAGLTALFVTASPLAYAQTAASAATPSSADWNTLTDMRIDVVKAALKMTPDQEKYWPPIEDAIRARAKNREARFADIEKRVAEMRDGNPVEVLRNCSMSALPPKADIAQISCIRLIRTVPSRPSETKT